MLYTVKTEGDSIRFLAVATSPTLGKMEWDGVVKGNTVEAKYVWTKERWYWNMRVKRSRSKAL